MSMVEPTRCLCMQFCGDVDEEDDDPRAVCKALPMPPAEPLGSASAMTVLDYLREKEKDNPPWMYACYRIGHVVHNINGRKVCHSCLQDLGPYDERGPVVRRSG